MNETRAKDRMLENFNKERRRVEKMIFAVWGFILLWALLGVCVVGGLIWVIIHFLAKIW